MPRAELALAPVLAAAAIVTGVFAPLADIEVYGSVSLFDVSQVQAVLLLAVASAALLAGLTGGRRWLPLCALGAWAGLFYPLLERWLTPRDESALGQLSEAFSSAVHDAFGDVVLDVAGDVTQARWGVLALVGGCVLLTVAAWRRR